MPEDLYIPASDKKNRHKENIIYHKLYVSSYRQGYTYSKAFIVPEG